MIIFESIKKFFQKQKDIAPVEIVSSKTQVNLQSLENLKFYFQNSSNISDWSEDLEFKSAFQIEHAVSGEGIGDLIFKVRGRQFKDLSFALGKDIEIFEVQKRDFANAIREYEDGKRFFHHYHSIPTFDSYDRDWDGDCVVDMFRDDAGIHLIHSQFGYNIPRIEIYLTLKNIPDRFKNWLEFLN